MTDLLSVPGFNPGRTVWVIEQAGITVHKGVVATASIWMVAGEATVSYEVTIDPATADRFRSYGRIASSNMFATEEAAEQERKRRRDEIREWMASTGQIPSKTTTIPVP